MRKICYSVAMSLDGFVAGPNGEADWIVMDPEIDFRQLFSRFDTALMGRKTFEASQGQGHSMMGMKAVVVSKTLKPKDFPKLTVIGEDIVGPINQLKAAAGKDIWLFGGGSLFKSLLDLGLVDNVEVAIIPVLLGGGVPFLPERKTRSKLQLVDSRIYRTTGTVSLVYQVNR